MSCLSLTAGTFTPLNWSNAPSASSGPVTVTRTASDVTVTRTGVSGSITVSSVNGGAGPQYCVFGSLDAVVILTFDGGPLATRRVTLVDFTGTSLAPRTILQITLPSTQALPVLSMSPGTGSLLFVWTGTGTPNEATDLQIVRANNGAVLLSPAGAFLGITAAPTAEVTATELVIHHPRNAGTNQTSRLRPAGSLTVDPPVQDFGQAILGGANPAQATATRSFTLRNDGDDCLTINGIQSSAPFSLAAPLPAFPVILDPGQLLTVNVLFQPLAPGTFNASVLTVARTPANGIGSLICSGSARIAIAAIRVSLTAIRFGTLAVGTTSPSVPFSVQNSGDLNLSVSIPGPAMGSPYNWPALNNVTLAVGGPATLVQVTFTPTQDAVAPAETITITPSLGTAQSIALTGAGCIPNATIVVPPMAPIAFNLTERGFRTVRFIEIRNDGDGDLTFRARIAGTNPAHFGITLPDHDITDAPATRNFNVLPTQRCGGGAGGDNRVIVAVSFFADDVPGNLSAELIIDSHNDPRATVPANWTFPLTAEIINPVPIDAVLVLDRSGSMADVIGVRQKSEAAVAGARLFVQMLRENADDRAAVIRFNETPDVVQPMLAITGNRPAFQAAVTPANFTPSGATNIAGGVILGEAEMIPHPANPPVLKRAMIVLTDGIENRCFQVNGAGPWLSITGRDHNDPGGMARPDGTPQDSDPLGTPTGIKVYGIGLGNPTQIDSAALSDLSTATGAPYLGVEQLTAADYFSLEKYFTQIFMESAGVAAIADPFFVINPGDTHQFEFDIFAGDVNAMVVIYDEPDKRLPFFIVSPKGEVLSGTSLPAGFTIRIHSTPTARFAEFRFPNREPWRYEGRWKVVVKHDNRVCSGDLDHKEGSDVGPGFTPKRCRRFPDPVRYGIAIGAGSNLQMQAFVEPGAKYVGDSIGLSALLAEAGLPVIGSKVTVTVDTPFGQTFTMPLHDDGASQDGQPDDGEYGGVFTKTLAVGNYQFKFHAEGLQGKKPYVRELQRTKAVLDRRKTPPGDGPNEGGANGGDCCKQILRALSREERLLRELIEKLRG
jgi:hypothetical protein